MLTAKRWIGLCFVFAALVASVATTSCAARVGVGYRVYDPYHRDYHRWNNDEVRFYGQWRGETRRDSRRDYRDLNRDEQREYWNWRHDRR